MTREELVSARSSAWHNLGRLLEHGERGLRSVTPAEIHQLSELYRSLAGDLMLARRDKLGADLERYLDDLAGRAHNLLYAGSRVDGRQKAIDLLLDFPAAVRRNAAFTLLALALFFVPGTLAGVAAYTDESYALALLSPAEMQNFEEMYREISPGSRSGDANAQMTGFYIWNNIGIAFRCFATGLIFGLGSLFFLLFNSLKLGVVVGHLARVGLGAKIFGYVAAHSPWELTAVVLSAAAGMQMGFALVKTGGRTRLGNLEAHGLELLRQIAGTAALLAVAAMIEGWLSPSSLPNEAKYVVGALGTVLVALILLFAGAGRPIPADVVLLRKKT